MTLKTSTLSIEGVEVLQDLNVSSGCTLLLGLSYLRYTFEFIQKVLMDMNRNWHGRYRSSKVNCMSKRNEFTVYSHQ